MMIPAIGCIPQRCLLLLLLLLTSGILLLNNVSLLRIQFGPVFPCGQSGQIWVSTGWVNAKGDFGKTII